ncbi:hypothetical protein [Alkalihalophilus marmarensis]
MIIIQDHSAGHTKGERNHISMLDLKVKYKNTKNHYPFRNLRCKEVA